MTFFSKSWVLYGLRTCEMSHIAVERTRSRLSLGTTLLCRDPALRENSLALRVSSSRSTPSHRSVRKVLVTLPDHLDFKPAMWRKLESRNRDKLQEGNQDHTYLAVVWGA